MKSAMRLARWFDLAWLFDWAFPCRPTMDRSLDFSPAANARRMRDPYYRLISYRSDWGDAIFRPLLRIPIIGRVLYAYWSSTVDDATALPLDAMAFAFLNDWMRPSAWHTWRSIIEPDAGLYVGRAPVSAIEAEWVERNERDLPLNQRVDR